MTCSLTLEDHIRLFTNSPISVENSYKFGLSICLVAPAEDHGITPKQSGSTSTYDTRRDVYKGLHGGAFQCHRWWKCSEKEDLRGDSRQDAAGVNWLKALKVWT